MGLGFYTWLIVQISKDEPQALSLICYVFYSFSKFIYRLITSVQPLFPGYICIRLGYLLHIHSRFLLKINFPELNSRQQGNCICKENTVHLPSVFHLINLYGRQNLFHEKKKNKNKNHKTNQKTSFHCCAWLTQAKLCRAKLFALQKQQ